MTGDSGSEVGQWKGVLVLQLSMETRAAADGGTPPSIRAYAVNVRMAAEENVATQTDYIVRRAVVSWLGGAADGREG